MSKVVEYVLSKREDILLFAASLLIALVLFMQLESTFIADAERELEVPLEFTNVGDDITVLQAVRTVKVRATGPQKVLDDLDLSNVSAFVDLADKPVGAERHLVEVTGPSREGLILTAVQAYVQIEIEARVTKQFEVTIVETGVPPKGFQYEGETVVPQSVEVSGPESIMNDVVLVRAVLDLTKILPNVNIEIDLEVLAEDKRPVPVVQTRPSRVMVSPAVSISSTVRKLLVNPIYVNQPDPDYKIRRVIVTPNQIDVTGGSGLLSRHTMIDTLPIDLRGLTRSQEFETEVVLPEGLTAEGGSTVTVRIEVEPR